MLRTIGITELTSIIEEQGNVGVACEFCNQKYVFDSVDIEGMFTNGVVHPTGDTRH